MHMQHFTLWCHASHTDQCIFVHPDVIIYLCKSVCICFPICLHVCVYVWLCMSIPQFYLSHAAEDPESYEHMQGRGVVGGGWMLVVGNPMGLFGRWWSEVSAAHLPLLFPVLSHPVIRVTVRSCLAPIGRANNSFNNPGPCNISLLFGPRCHAKSPAMEKLLHCRKDGMTGWTLSGDVCVSECVCVHAWMWRVHVFVYDRLTIV